MGMPIQLSTNLDAFSATDPGSWEPLLERARMLDDAGFDRITVPEHIVFGERIDEYGRPEIGGQKGGQQPTGPDGHWLDPLVILGLLAGITSKVRLGTNIMLAGIRRPVVLAKSAATLDVLSGGRFDLGVGVGWQREEYEAAGLDFAKRGRLLDHSLEVCQTLWTQQRAKYDSPELSFEKIHMNPKGFNPGGPPIWVSGSITPPVVRRVAKFGSGWIPWGYARENIRPGIVKMQQALTELGRDPATVQVEAFIKPVPLDNGRFDADATFDSVPELAQLGVTDFRVPLTMIDPYPDASELKDIVEAFRLRSSG